MHQIDRTEYPMDHWTPKYTNSKLEIVERTEADARAKMLIYLIEHKLVKV